MLYQEMLKGAEPLTETRIAIGRGEIPKPESKAGLERVFPDNNGGTDLEGVVSG